jgi:hypothetical protein
MSQDTRAVASGRYVTREEIGAVSASDLGLQILGPDHLSANLVNFSTLVTDSSTPIR